MSAVVPMPPIPGFKWEHGCIYYISSAETGRVKIGYTDGNPRKRLRALQTGSPTKLAILAVHPGTRDTERRLHEEFSGDRTHGEWFDLSDDLIVHIAQVYKLMIAAHQAVDAEPPRWAVVGLNGLIEMLEADEGETLQ